MDWEQCKSEDGRIFFLNLKTGEKSWVKPASAVDPSVNPTDWEEQTTQTGQTYYVNRKNNLTSLEMPDELQEWKNRVAALNFEAQILGEQSDMEECEEGQILDDQSPVAGKIQRKEEVREVYKQLFEEAGVTSTWKWEDFHRIMRDDDRYNIIKAIAQKKQFFQEHIQQLKKLDREEARQKKQVAKENFMKMLDSSGILRADSKFYKTAHFFQGDPRWRILEDKERVELFQDFLDELERRDREQQRQHRKQLMQQLRKIFDSSDEVAHTTKWAELQTLFTENQVFNSLDKLDQLNVFKEYIIESENQLAEAKKLEESTRARKNRENFRSLLGEMKDQGLLTAATHWNDMFKQVREDPRYLALAGQPGSTPKELFDELVESEKNQIREHVESLRDALINIEITPSLTYEDVKSLIDETLEGLDDPTRRIVFNVFFNDAIARQREEARKTAKAFRRFEEYLKNNPRVLPGCLLEDIMPEILGKPELYKRLSKADMARIFDEVTEQMKDDSQSDLEPGEIKHVSKKIDRKKHKKHKRDEHKKHKHKHKHRSSRSPP